MGIFSTVAEVAKNKQNFKNWEEQQKLEQSKRQQLYQNKHYSQKEIENARALGTTIIDAIDVMDNHSESVAENVETATEPLVFMAPFLGTIAGTIGAFKFAFNPAFAKQQSIRKEVLNSDAAKNLYEKVQSDFKNRNKNFSLEELLNKNKINQIEDFKLKKEAQRFLDSFSKQTSKYKKNYWIGGGAILASLLASFIGATIAATKIQINSSKVARFQARKELEDPKSFVHYTPEQVEQAKADLEAERANGKKRKKKEKSSLKQGFFGSLFSIMRDNKAYKNAKKNNKIEPKPIERELTPEEIIQAEKDKEVIQRTVRIINNEAEKNSENMETTADVIIGGTPILGALVGGAMSWILNKTGIVDKAINKSIQKNASKETLALLETYNKVRANKNIKGVKGLFIRGGHYFNYVGSMIADLKNEQQIVNGIKQEPKASAYVKRLSTALMTSNTARNKVIAVIGAITTGFAGLILGLKLQKSAARAGRYTAKRELEKDPRNFIGYTQEEYDEIKDAKPVKTESRFKEVTLFIPRVLKQYSEYNRYRKNEAKEEAALRKHLLKQEVSEEQLKDAKNLQRKIFNTFEKVDDNSQKYSESMEAAIDIIKPFVTFGTYIGLATPIVAGIVGLVKMRENPAKIIEKVTGWMKKSSNLVNSKLSKRYLNNVAKNVSAKTSEVTVDDKPLAFLLKDVNLQDDNIIKSLGQVIKNLKLSPDELRKLPEEEINKKINDAIYNLIEKPLKDNTDMIANLKIINSDKFKGIKQYLFNIKLLPADLKIDALDMVLNPSNINKIKPENYEKIMNGLIGFIPKQSEMLGDLVNKLPVKNLKELTENLSKIDEFKEILSPTKLSELNNFLEIIEKNPDKAGEELIKKLASQNNIASVFRTLNNMFDKIKSAPQAIKNNPTIQKMLNHEFSISYDIARILKNTENLFEDPKVLSSKINKLIKEAKNSDGSVKESIFDEILTMIGAKDLSIDTLNKHKVSTNLNNIINGAEKSLNNIKSLKTEDFKEMFSEFAQKPSNMIKDLKDSIINSSEENIQSIIDKTPILKNINKLDKDSLVKILSNVEGVIDNIPKEELKNIMNSIIKEFNKNPDEFVKLVRDGKIASIFMTPGLKKTLSAIGISIPVVTIIFTYIVESWLAGMQIKAGRLGVMKSLEDLNDPRYYANLETENLNN